VLGGDRPPPRRQRCPQQGSAGAAEADPQRNGSLRVMMGNQLSFLPTRDEPSPQPPRTHQPSTGLSLAINEPATIWASSFPQRRQRSSTGVALTIPSSGTISARMLGGTLYRMSPAAFGARRSAWVHHPFDGDGMITALPLNPGAASLCNRFVATEGWAGLKAADKVQLSGVFGTRNPGGPAANAFRPAGSEHRQHPLWCGWATSWLALWEASSTARARSLTPWDNQEALDLRRAPWRGEALQVPILASIRATTGERRMVHLRIKSGPRSNGAGPDGVNDAQRRPEQLNESG